MKILKALYAVELLLAVGARASRGSREGQGGNLKGAGTNRASRESPRRYLKGNGNNGNGNDEVVVDTCTGPAWGFCSTSDNVDVTIIGAGTTAMAAGRFIERYNAMNYQNDMVTYRILEAEAAEDHNFGRVIASYFLHGAEGHPLYEIKHIQETERGHTTLLEWDTKWADVKHFRCTGDYGNMDSTHCEELSNNVVNSESGDFNKVAGCVRDEDKLGLMLDDALDMCYDEELSSTLADGDNNRIWYAFDYDMAESPESTVNTRVIDGAVYDCTGQDKDIHLNGGVKPIIEREYEFYGIDECSCAGAKVEKIEFSLSNSCDYCIEVKVEGIANPFKTKQVILTPSVGVLARGDIEIPDLGVGDDKYNKMMNVFFTPNVTMTKRAEPGEEYNPLYYAITFQLPDSNVTWDRDYAFINVDFTDRTIPRGMCRWWEVWNDKWGDWTNKDNNMITCHLTTEGVEYVEGLYETLTGATDYSIPEYNGTKDGDLDEVITDLFRNSIGIAYGITVPDCYRCGSPGQNCTDSTDPFIPTAPAPPLGLNECRYRVFPNKDNDLWYGSYENVNNWTAFNGDDYQDFIDPIINSTHGAHKATIHMAGAATCYNYYAYLQGSYYSGIGAANASLTNIKGSGLGTLPDDEKLDQNWCPYPPPFSIGNPRSGCD